MNHIAICQTILVKANDQICGNREYEIREEQDNIRTTISEIIYNFQLINSIHSQEKVIAIQTIREEKISSKGDCLYRKNVFYDSQSNIIKAKYLSSIYKRMPSNDFSYQRDNIFESDERVKSFPLYFYNPEDKVKYEIKKRYNDLRYLTCIYFHDDTPIQEKTILFEVPSWLDIEFKEMNFEDYNIEKEILSNPKKKETLYTYKIKNIKAWKSEDYSPGPSYYLPHIIILCKGYISKYGIRKNLFGTIDDLYSWYHSLVQSVNNNAEILQPFVNKLIQGKKTDKEKIASIYYWVQDNIRYIAFEDGIAGYQPDACQHVFEKQYADCKGIANLTKEMLKLAGYDVRLTWVGTRRLAYDYSIPSLLVDNHMICTLFMNSERFFLDGTEPYIALGENAFRIQGQQVLIENGDKWILDTVPELPKENNKMQIQNECRTENGALICNSKMSFSGERKRNMLYHLNNTKVNEREKLLIAYVTGNTKNYSIIKLDHSALNNREDDFTINALIEISNQITEIENKLFISLGLEQYFQYPLIDASRSTDFVFTYKIYDVTEMEFHIPQGYDLNHLPSSFKKAKSNFEVEMKYAVEGKKIICQKIISISNPLIKKKDFNAWNDYIIELNNNYNSPIVLERK